MNVLMTSCGAKVMLARAWRHAVHHFGGQLIALDSQATSPALFEADQALLSPALTEPQWSSFLLTVCQHYQIALVVPTADYELASVAALAPQLRADGHEVLIATPKTIRICLDKRLFARYCSSHHIPLPRTWRYPDQVNQFPVFVRGQRHHHYGRVDSAAVLHCYARQERQLLIQDYVADAEYSVDLLMDFAGQPLQAVARRRLRIGGGEAVVSQVEHCPALTTLAQQLGQQLQLVGHNVVQSFWSAEHGARLIEVNPRFGGISSLSIRAGLDSPARLLALLAQDQQARTERPIEIGLTVLRYGEDRFCDRQGTLLSDEVKKQ
jgi:carbamoyl-phosphate synthase large subunit